MALTRDQATSETTRLYNNLNGRRREIERYERYFRGDQKLKYATDEWAKIHDTRFHGFSDNWCGVVGSAPGERTAIDGIRLGNDTEPLSADERSLWHDWQINEMEAQSSQGFLLSTIAKRSAVLVWGNSDDEPVVTWEHPAQVLVDYDPDTRQPRANLKAWTDGDDEFATLYTADEVWKFQRKVVAGNIVDSRTESGLYLSLPVSSSFGAWEPRETPGETWPLPNPMGLPPMVEFPNRPMLGGSPLSDIAGAAAMQDAVNLLWAYLFTAADFASMPARVVMGQEPPKVPILDENGQKIGEKPVDIEALTKGRMLWLTGQNTSIGQWDAAKLDVFTAVVNVAVKHIASQTRTPIHYIVGDLGNVNGETLTATETPLAMKVRESHKFYTPATREVFRRMALVRGDVALAEECRTARIQWRNPETRSEAQLADAALKDKTIGFPLAWIAEKRYGLTQTEIDRLMSMRRDEAADPVIGQLLRGAGSDLTGTDADLGA